MIRQSYRCIWLCRRILIHLPSESSEVLMLPASFMRSPWLMVLLERSAPAKSQNDNLKENNQDMTLSASRQLLSWIWYLESLALPVKLVSGEHHLTLDDKLTLIQIMACCHHTSHYQSQSCSSSVSPYGVTRLQWVHFQLYHSKVEH